MDYMHFWTKLTSCPFHFGFRKMFQPLEDGRHPPSLVFTTRASWGRAVMQKGAAGCHTYSSHTWEHAAGFCVQWEQNPSILDRLEASWWHRISTFMLQEGTGFDYAVGSMVRWEVTPPIALTSCSINWRLFGKQSFKKHLQRMGRRRWAGCKHNENLTPI